MNKLDAVTAEIVRLHDFIAAWLRGEIARDRFDAEFAEAMHPDFEIIEPSGAVQAGRAVIDAVRSGHGANPEFGIGIEEPRLIAELPGHLLAGYVEVQTGARKSAAFNRRRSTVLLESGPRLRWRHLHETRLE